MSDSVLFTSCSPWPAGTARHLPGTHSSSALRPQALARLWLPDPIRACGDHPRLGKCVLPVWVLPCLGDCDAFLAWPRSRCPASLSSSLLLSFFLLNLTCYSILFLHHLPELARLLRPRPFAPLPPDRIRSGLPLVIYYYLHFFVSLFFLPKTPSRKKMPPCIDSLLPISPGLA